MDQTHLNSGYAPILIDLDQFKLHLTLPERKSLSLHFDTPSRRFYLSVIALVAEQMRRNDRIPFVPMEDHAETLALLNETVGGSAGSSDKKKLLPRIYRKWKDALPDLENAPLFKVVGRKKGFDDGLDKIYRFDQRTKDAWANLFEYSGSGEKVRFRFSVEKVEAQPKDISIVYGGKQAADAGEAWDLFIDSLQGDAQSSVRTEKGAAGNREPERNVIHGFNELLKEPVDIDKIPLKTRLELIARLAMAPKSGSLPENRDVPMKPGHDSESPSKNPDLSGAHSVDAGMMGGADPGITERLIESIFKDGKDSPLYIAPELQDGRSPSPRSDVYALGVLLYQVVGDLSRPLDADWKEVVIDNILREDIAACVEALPEKRLPDPLALSRRLRTLDERRRLMLLESPFKTQNAPSSGRRKRRWIAYGFAMAIILALLALPAWYYQKVSRVEAAKKQAYETHLPKIRQLLENEKYVAAHALARETEKIIPHDPTLRGYIQDATCTFDIETMPAGARVFYRSYTDLEGPWIDLGVTPIKEAIVPVGMHRFKIDKEGYKERNLVRAVLPRDAVSVEYEKWTVPLFGNPFKFDLYEKEQVPDDMVPVDRGRFVVALKGVPVKTTGMVLDRFFYE